MYVINIDDKRVCECSSLEEANKKLQEYAEEFTHKLRLFADVDLHVEKTSTSITIRGFLTRSFGEEKVLATIKIERLSPLPK